MKLIYIFSTFVIASKAQTSDEDRLDFYDDYSTDDEVLTIGNPDVEQLLAEYKHVVDNGGNSMDKKFSDALIGKATVEGLPSHVAEQISEKIAEAGMNQQPLRSIFCQGGVCNAPLGMSGIWGYGCWCNFGNSLLQGRSVPVNRFDELCRDMQLCLRCAVKDADNGSYACDPKTKEYVAFISFLPTSLSLHAQCSVRNPGDPCAAHVCTCEMDLINELLQLLWSSVTYVSTYLHDNGWVPDADNCPPTGGVNSHDECCGYYPDRFPYGDTRQCCVSHQTLYYPSIQDCCSHGVDLIGNCL